VFRLLRGTCLGRDSKSPAAGHRPMGRFSEVLLNDMKGLAGAL